MKRIIETVLLCLLSLIVLGVTASAGTVTSAGSGNWSSTGTWSGGVVPASTDDVVIADGMTVTIDQAVTANSLTIGQGVSGILTFDGVAARAVVVAGDISVATGGTFIVQSTGTFTNTLSIGGNVTNNGTIDMSRNGSTTLCNVTFTYAGDQTISGSTPVLTRFRGVTLNKGAVANRVVASIDVTMAGSGLWVFTNGTWEQTAGTLSETSGSQTIAATGAFTLSGSGSFNMVTAGSLTVTGALTVNTSGSFGLGSGNNSVTVGSATSLATFTAGTMSIYGRLTITNGSTVINGAAILIYQQSTNLLSGTSNAFECSGGNLTFSSGSVTIVDPNGGTGGVTGRDVKLTSTGTVNLTGSTISLGDGVSTLPASQAKCGFYINSSIPLYNLVIQGGGVAGRNDSLSSNVTINGTLTRKSGSFVASGGKTFTYGASSTLLYNGTSQQSTGLELSSTVNNLTINNSAGVVLNSAVTVNGVLTLAAGLLDNSVNQVTLGSSGSVVNAGGSMSQAPLPVELTSFGATTNKAGIELSWTTATEVNNYGFDVERKTVDKDWTKIAFVAGNGTSNVVHSYSYTDQLGLGTYSYRLKQIDHDGRFQYSQVVEATVGLTPNLIALGQNYPNPFNPETSIDFAVPATGRATLKVYNMLGQEIATLVNGTVQAGVVNHVTFRGSGFPSGMYFYTLRSGSFTATNKMLMVK